MSAEVDVAEEEKIPDMSLLDITDGENERKIPVAKFIDDIGDFSASFDPPASAELLIGAYTELYNKYKTYEATLTRKRELCCCCCGGGGGVICIVLLLLLLCVCVCVCVLIFMQSARS